MGRSLRAVWIGALLAVQSSCASLSAAGGGDSGEVAALLRNRKSVESYDYWSVTHIYSEDKRIQFKTRLGESGKSTMSRTGSCPTQNQGIALAALATSAKEPDQSKWAQSWSVALDRYRDFTDHWTLVRRGKKDNAVSLDDDRISELYRRAKMDQQVRDSFSFSNSSKMFSSAIAREAYDRMVGFEMCRTDEENAKWLNVQMQTLYWFDKQTFGVKADQDAWLIAQHMDMFPSIQDTVLSRLEILARKSQTDPANYAYLFDRVAVNRGRKQRFGTQMHCQGAGRWEPLPIEDPAGVNTRREALGLEAMEAYARSGAHFCP